MATLGSASTLENAIDQYRDNSGYLEDNSVAAAKLFVSACIWLIQAIASKQIKGTETVEIQTIEVYRGEKEAALLFINAFTPGGSVIHYGFANFRR